METPDSGGNDAASLAAMEGVVLERVYGPPHEIVPAEDAAVVDELEGGVDGGTEVGFGEGGFDP